MFTDIKPLFQSGETFLRDLKSSIASAKERIWIQVMIFEIVPKTEVYVELLIAAAKRGVDVWFIVDWITELYYDYDLNTIPSPRPSAIKKRRETHELAEKMFARLRDGGVRLIIDNKPGTIGKRILLGKRNHNKIFIIDTVAWVGGVNFIASPERFIDFMVKLFDPRIITVLKDYFLHKPDGDMAITCTDMYTFLIDRGLKWKSLIYQEANRLIDRAEKEITLVSQLLPDNDFLNTMLKKSQQNILITIVISHKDHNIFTRFPFRIHYDSFLKKIQHNRNVRMVHASQKIHAKLLISEKEAIFGSHNFASWNELIGIEETGFLTNDPVLLKQFETFYKELVK